ncbi:hypothetical protein [Tenacibaculum halocynthiae]|uniref:hypothetical protein n=1 Tax=Tenacibaculum halocynthiae TaxID=1254437 RepID=UPI0038959A6F
MKSFKLQILIIALILSPCLLFSQDFSSDYIALAVPEHWYGKIYHVNPITKTVSVQKVDTLRHDKTLLDSFNNLVSNVTIYNVKGEGELSIVGAGVSVKGENYQVIYDFSQTQTVKNNGGQNYSSFLVGVSVRMVAKFQALKGKINLSSPFSLSANIEKIKGSLEVRVSGIGSKKINDIIPTTSDLSPSSIATALQAVATIKSHIYDNETIITPQLLAYSKVNKEISKELEKENSNKPIRGKN